MSGTSKGGEKAAQTRGHASLSMAGKRGAAARTHESRVNGGKKAALKIGHVRLSEAGKKGAAARLNLRQKKSVSSGSHQS